MPSFAARIDDFHEQAARATGLSDFGADDYREPMRLALADYDRHSVLNEVGRGVTEGAIVGLLTGRLLAEAGFRQHPDFAQASITRPIIIIGQLRSGTTALLQLLSKDPHNQWLAPWLGSAPMPRPPQSRWAENPWYQAMDQGLRAINQLCPMFEQCHPVYADQPDECRFATQQTFWSPTIASTTSTPEYTQWCVDADARPVFARYRRLLGLIAGGDARRWLLKDPCHLWVLEALMEAFPDACLVYIHRDPTAALVSAANMIHAYRQTLGAQPRDVVGREQIPLWARAQARAEAVRARHDDGRFCDVHNDELRRDPVATARRIYAHFGLPLGADTIRAWEAHAVSGQRAGQTPNQLSVDDFGLTEREIQKLLGPYHDRYASLYAR